MSEPTYTHLLAKLTIFIKSANGTSASDVNLWPLAAVGGKLSRFSESKNLSMIFLSSAEIDVS